MATTTTKQSSSSKKATSTLKTTSSTVQTATSTPTSASESTSSHETKTISPSTTASITSALDTAASTTLSAHVTTTPISDSISVTPVSLDPKSSTSNVATTSVPFTSSDASTTLPAAATINSQSSNAISSMQKSSDMSAGTIAGIVLGTIAAATLLAGVIIFFWWRARRSRQEHGASGTLKNLEGRLSRLEEKHSQVAFGTDEVDPDSDRASGTGGRARSWSDGESRRFSQMPAILAPITTTSNNSSSWSVIKSPSREHLPKAADVAEASFAPPVPASTTPVTMQLVSPMEEGTDDGASIATTVKASPRSSDQATIADSNGEEDRQKAKDLAEAAVQSSTRLRRASQIPKLKVVETKPETQDEHPMVSPISDISFKDAAEARASTPHSVAMASAKSHLSVDGAEDERPE